MMPAQAIDGLLASILRGEVTQLDALVEPADEQAFVSAAAEQGVASLVRWHLQQRGVWSSVPPGVSVALDDRARRQSLLETAQLGAVTKVLATLRDSGVEALVLKGWGLAYTHYPEAYLRQRTDIDILVRRPDLDQAVMQLERLGYERVNSVSREAVHKQLPFEWREGPVRHAVDLHWAVSNRPLFADMLSFDELLQGAAVVTPLGDGARTPGPVHALLLACVHRIAHHDDSDRLCWLYDIRLLADSLSPEEWAVLGRLATDKKITTVCRESLRLTARRVGCGAETRKRIAAFETSMQSPIEPSAAYMGGIGTGFRSFALDLKDTKGTAERLQWLKGLLFPDESYMRNAYGVTNRLGLALAYTRRGARGLWRTLRGTRVR